MRDPARIDPMLDKIREIWYTNPDLRLTQLLGNTFNVGSDGYYMEDDVLLERLDKVYVNPSTD